ncbi:MAG: DUF429 domain-containing protein [Candidatus Hydrothermales bacterium]
MIFGGIDLSIRDKNKAICFIENKRKPKIILLKRKVSDKEIIDLVKKYKPVFLSIDAPLKWKEFVDRKEDKILRKYLKKRKIKNVGVLPFYVKSMMGLSKKGRYLYSKLKNITKVLETHPTASIRANGFEGNYKKNKEEFKKILKRLKYKFMNIEMIKNHNELDALFCALFSLYYFEGKNIVILRKKIPYGIIVKI